MKIIKFIQTILIAYILLLNTVFSKTSNLPSNTLAKSYSIESFAKIYSQIIDKEVKKYNQNRTKPRTLFKSRTPREQKLFFNILSQYRIKELPEILTLKNKYLIISGNHKFEFDLLSLFKNTFILNKKVLKFNDYKYDDVQKLINLYRHHKKVSIIESVLMDNANALIVESIIIVTLLTLSLIGYNSSIAFNDLGIEKIFDKMTQEIIRLSLQCEEDLLYPQEIKQSLETIYMVSLFQNRVFEQTKKLEEHFYNIISKRKKGHIKCNDVLEYIKDEVTTLKMKYKEKDLLSFENKVCESHIRLKKCLSTFEEKLSLTKEKRLDKITKDQNSIFENKPFTDTASKK